MHNSFSSPHTSYHPPDVFLALIPSCSIRTHHHAHSSISCYLPHTNLLFSDPATCPLTTRPPCHHQRSSLPATQPRCPIPSSTPSAFHPPPYDQPQRGTLCFFHPPHFHLPLPILSALPPSAGCLPTIHVCISFTVMSILISRELCMNSPPLL